MIVKRLVAATFVTALTVAGIAPAAHAAGKKSDSTSSRTAKAPGSSTGGASANRIDWD